MSRCRKTEQLESLVLGELNLARANELEQHTSHCAACHHELNWLKSERLMFEQRLARDTVGQLWVGFAARRAAPVQQHGWSRWTLAMAATVILMVGVSASLKSPRLQSSASFESSAPMSLEEMSRDLGSDSRDCSRLQPGTGFACGPFLPASFALRE